MLVRNLSTVTLNLRKGGQKFVLQPGKATTIPEFLFTKEEIKAIYGSYVQVLNDSLEVVDTPVNVEKKETKVVEEVVEAVDEPEVIEQPPVEEKIEEVETTEEAESADEPEVAEKVEETAEEDKDIDAALDEVLDNVEVAEAPKKTTKKGGRKPAKKAQ